MKWLLVMLGGPFALLPASVLAFGFSFGQVSAAQTLTVSALPPEARSTLQLIKQGGPFPYPRDGVVFGNYERVLPKQPRGYYHEYTVKTPGAHNRGARRIVCGVVPECYYTGDHYQIFQRIEEGK